MDNHSFSPKVSRDSSSSCIITNNQAANLFLKSSLLSNHFYKWDKYTLWTATLTTLTKNQKPGPVILSCSMKINRWWKGNQTQRATINKATLSSRETTCKHLKQSRADKIKSRITFLSSLLTLEQIEQVFNLKSWVKLSLLKMKSRANWIM
jgi:hypothetical protein